MKRVIGMAFLVLIIASLAATAANTAPVVSAGNDTTTRLGLEFRFQGDIQDESAGTPELIVEWTQLAGPAGGAEILAPDAERSMVEFTAKGQFTFRLSANDGQYTRADTVRVTVMDSIPFLIKTPSAGQRIEAGSSFRITWQIDPVGTSVVLSLSADGGENFPTELVIVNSQVRDSFYVWEVPATLVPGDNYVIMAAWYFKKYKVTYSDVFSIVPKGSAVKPADRTRPAILVGNNRPEDYSLDGRRIQAVKGSRPTGSAIQGMTIRRGGEEAGASKAVVR